MPSGDVASRPGVGLVVMPTCEKAGLQPSKIIAAAIRRLFIFVLLLRYAPKAQAASWSGGAMNSGPTGSVMVSRRMRSISVIAAELMRQPMAPRTAAS
jgi:hypothetical protein